MEVGQMQRDGRTRALAHTVAILLVGTACRFETSGMAQSNDGGQEPISDGSSPLADAAEPADALLTPPRDAAIPPVPDAAPRVKLLKMEPPPQRKAGVIVEDVPALLEKLRNEAKVL